MIDPRPIYAAFLAVLGERPLADFPDVLLVPATETADLPGAYVVLSVSLKSVPGLRGNATADFSAEFSLCLPPEGRAREEVESAFSALIESVAARASAAALSAAAREISAPVFFYSAALARIDAPSYARDRLVQSLAIEGQAQF